MVARRLPGLSNKYLIAIVSEIWNYASAFPKRDRSERNIGKLPQYDGFGR